MIRVSKIGEGQVISHYALRLPPLARQKTINGVVLSTDGPPLAGVLVNHGQPNEFMTSNVKTDEYGRFRSKLTKA
jgi:hypothetical protein